ncbi:hypothetical protein BDP67DRAFT_569215 [Colletotrichum lupini]|nr:hypothetical protein BDP67DRAFT_569215 [Colletotrichum lupini]
MAPILVATAPAQQQQQCTILDLGAETTCGFSLGSSCSCGSSSSLSCDSRSCIYPNHRTTSGRGSRQPEVEAKEREREEKHGPNGNMIAEKTWKEHKRADTTAKEGTVQDPKCRKCQKQTYVCIRKETGPCQVCMRMSEVCSFTGQSKRNRELKRRERLEVKVKKVANTVTDPPDDPATHQAGQKRGPESSFLDVKDDSQVPDLPVDFRQQAEPSIFKNKVEDIGESGSHASGSSGLGLRSRTLSISPPPVVRKRSDEVEENAGEDFGPRTKRRLSEVVVELTPQRKKRQRTRTQPRTVLLYLTGDQRCLPASAAIPQNRRTYSSKQPHHSGTESLVLVQTFGQTPTGHREKTIKDAIRGYPDLKQHCHRGQSDYQIKAKTEIVPQLLIESRTLSTPYPMSALRSPRWAEAGLPTQFPKLSTGAGPASTKRGHDDRHEA